MPYNSVTSRTDAAALIPDQVSNEMLGVSTEASATLELFRRIPVGRAQVRFPVLAALPLAYWVSGDTGLKQTTEMAWANKYLNIEEIATIMPVPDNVLADVEADIWDEAQPLLAQAFARTLDSAVFFGVNAPASFPTNIFGAVGAAGNVVNAGTSAAANGGFYGDIDLLHQRVEEDGFEVTGWLGATAARARLRQVRDTTGQKLDANRVSGTLDSLDGVPLRYPMRGLWPTYSAGPPVVNGILLLGGQWDQFVVGVRQDIDFKVLTEAVIQDNTGAIVFNLAQQDMTAVRLTFRVGWQVVNTYNNDRPTESARYPVGAIQTTS